MTLELALLVLLGAAAGAPPPAPLDCDTGSESVRRARDVAAGIIVADNARDIERVLQYYAVDAILLPPGEPAVSGRGAIRPRYERLFAEFDPRIEARLDEACAGGSFAFVRGRNGGRLEPRGAGEARILDDAYLMLLRPEADGVWRITHLMWHPASRPPSPAAGPER